MDKHEFIYGDTQKYSNCCSSPDRFFSTSDGSYSDYGICPECGEHCIYLTSEELEREDGV